MKKAENIRTFPLFCRLCLNDAGDLLQQFFLPVSRLGGSDDDVPLAESEALRNRPFPLLYLHSRKLIALRRNDGKGNDMIVQKLYELQIIVGRIPSDIDEQKDVLYLLLALEKAVENLSPTLFFPLGNGGITITGEIGKPKFTEIEVIDKSRPSGRSACLCQIFSVGKHIDERAFPRIAPAADGDHGTLGV